jgi:hypothetical protein
MHEFAQGYIYGENDNIGRTNQCTPMTDDAPASG